VLANPIVKPLSRQREIGNQLKPTPSQNINKNKSIKVNVFELNFAPNALIFIDHILFKF
jgi:hypothetical protein